MQDKYQKLLFNSSSVFLSFLIYLVPISLILGPAIPNIIISFSSIFFIIISILLRLGKYYKNNFFKFFIIFWLFIVFNSFFSEKISVSLWNAITYLRFGIFAIVIIFALNTNKNFFKYFSYIYIPVFLLLIFDTFFQKIFVYNLFGFYTCWKFVECSRLSGFFRSEWILGSYIFHFFSLFIILILWFKFTKFKFKTILIFFLFFAGVLATYFTGERASFLKMFALSVAFIFANFNYKKYKKNIIICSVVVTLILLALISNNGRYNYLSFTHNESPEKNISTLTVYENLYHTAFNMFLDRPVSGHGNQMFRYKCSNQKYKSGLFYCNNHPHNYYFQLLAENGIVGFCFLITFFLYLSKVSLRLFISLSNKNDFRKASIFLLSSNLLLGLVPFLPSGNFYTSVSGVFIFTTIGLLYGMKYHKKFSTIKTYDIKAVS